jgi:hypothetical protein
MDSRGKPWIKINSETYLECIVGNASGLNILKNLIDSAIKNKGCDVEPHIKSDFKVIVCTEDKFEETESQELPMWQTVLFYTAMVIWLGILLITGIVLFIRWWLSNLTNASTRSQVRWDNYLLADTSCIIATKYLPVMLTKLCQAFHSRVGFYQRLLTVNYELLM